MKKLVMVLLGVGTLCATQEDEQKKSVEESITRQGERIHDTLNDFMRSEENKMIVDTVLYAGRVAWERTRTIFYDGKEVKYGNVSLALAIGLGYVLGRRFSGIGRIRRQLNELRGEVDKLQPQISKEISTQFAKHDADLTKRLLELQRNVGDMAIRTKGGPTAP